ncbi:hypothetical protein IAT38_003590 [Cryptococcus sp. DSM 104549]
MASSFTSPLASPPDLTLPLASLPDDITSIILRDLQRLIPCTIALLSRSWYEAIIPILYETVVISQRNAPVAFAGVCGGAEKIYEKGGYPYGGIDYSSRKAQAFAHTKHLVLKDVWAAEALVMCTRLNPQKRLEQPYRRPHLFLSLIHLTVGNQLNLALPVSDPDRVPVGDLGDHISHQSYIIPNYDFWEIFLRRIGNCFLEACEVDGLLASLAKPKYLHLDWMFAEAEISREGLVYDPDWLGTMGVSMIDVPFIIEWFFYSAEEQHEPLGELLETTIQLKFITTPAPGAKVQPKIQRMHERLLGLSENELVREQAAMIYKIRRRITLESENMMELQGDHAMIPHEDLVEDCEVEFCVKGAKGVAKAWKQMEREAAEVPLGVEVMKKFFKAWEGIFKFTEPGQEGDPLKRVHKDDGEEGAGDADDW